MHLPTDYGFHNFGFVDSRLRKFIRNRVATKSIDSKTVYNTDAPDVKRHFIAKTLSLLFAMADSIAKSLIVL